MKAEDWLDRPYHIRLQQRDDGDGAYWFATGAAGGRTEPMR